ncbi:MAG: hypothetical protein RI964_13 [Pseudomonadota bacterium]|jgi:uncharacterized protein YaiE (UPF0345 family)
MSQFDNVSVVKTANVYFDGKCVSHTVLLADGTRKSVGVILPSTLTFNTGAPEVMELLQGRCRVRLAGSETWQEYTGGQSFDAPANSAFDIETLEDLHYVCHFG